jgi:hypothetical protein
MHIDHTSDLPAIIMHLYMRDRKRLIAVTGPGPPRNDVDPEGLNKPDRLAVNEALYIFAANQRNVFAKTANLCL